MRIGCAKVAASVIVVLRRRPRPLPQFKPRRPSAGEARLVPRQKSRGCQAAARLLHARPHRLSALFCRLIWIVALKSIDTNKCACRQPKKAWFLWVQREATHCAHSTHGVLTHMCSTFTRNKATNDGPTAESASGIVFW